MLYIKSLVLIYLVTGSFNILTTFFQFSFTRFSESDNHKSYLFFCELSFSFFSLFLNSSYKWDHTVFVFLWLFSLNIMLSRSILWYRPSHIKRWMLLHHIVSQWILYNGSVRSQFFIDIVIAKVNWWFYTYLLIWFESEMRLQSMTVKSSYRFSKLHCLSHLSEKT